MTKNVSDVVDRLTKEAEDGDETVEGDSNDVDDAFGMAGSRDGHGEEGQGDGTQSSLGSGHWVHVDVVNDVINAPWL